MNSQPSRRQALGTISVAGVVGAGLAGCSSGEEQTATSGSNPVEISAADVPEGGGVVDQAAKVVVTQPSAGEYKAFDAVCPHERCLVSKVADGQIVCPCHGSAFSVEDGSVLQGPATTGLAPRTVTDSDGTLTVS